MTSSQRPEQDPLESFESVPAVSFHEPNGGHPKGEWVKLKVLDWPKLLEQKDDDGEVERWDNGDPKLVLVASVEDDGEKRSLWAKKMGKKATTSMYRQIVAAQKKVREELEDPNYRLKPGDTLALQYVGDDKSVPAKKGNHPKMFKAVIKVGAELPPTNDDPLTENSGQASEDSDPWGDPAAKSEPTTGGDPFAGGADAEDEPPFAHRTGFDVALMRGDALVV